MKVASIHGNYVYLLVLVLVLLLLLLLLLLVVRWSHRQTGLQYEVCCPLQILLASIQFPLQRSLLRPDGLPQVVEIVTSMQDVFCRLVFLAAGAQW